MSSRIVSKIAKGRDTSDGAGVKLKRVIGGPILDLDPFLLLDEFKSDKADDYIEGFPSHPHRGFETVTYMLAGVMEHQDHKGNKGLLTPGSIQWMTAGRGIIHSEMPKQENGLMHGFQLWVNLPSKLKMMEPRYQDIPPSDVPVLKEQGVTVKVLAGKYHGQEGPVSGIITNPLYLDVELAAGATFSEEIPVGHSSFAYVFQGDASFGPKDNQKQVNTSHAAVLDGNAGQTHIDVTAGDKGARFILIAAAPINEKVCRYGPFVMTTNEEINQAFDDYHSGLALLFPGQGSQVVGMTKDLVQDYPYLMPLFKEADRLLSFNLSNVMWNSEMQELKQTEVTQPAVLLHSNAILQVLEKEIPNFVTPPPPSSSSSTSSTLFKVDFMLGHSLGEYTALMASKSLEFNDAIQLVRNRGSMMKQSKDGKMAALLSKANMLTNGSYQSIKSTAQEMFDQSSGQDIVSVSNINSPSQLVISGNESGVTKLIDVGKKNKWFNKAIRLEVSAAFHSPLMKDCSQEYNSNYLNKIHFNQPIIPVISNVTAKPYKGQDSIKPILSKQMVSTVDWVSSIQYCIDKWENEKEKGYFIEIGPNKVLSQLLNQSHPNFQTISIGTSEELKEFIKKYKDNTLFNE
ncbi:pirin family protein [Cavenderia fasciculata]|uniref:Pirin family protein n=1 Tax=Cavenderia fasciculata TaxID=261658 RepID=F4Q355_CACFS|nr:pirin family protein [Cavenderia fasciculata]EGG16777.1 pirin family protein [Cavenderia fasciculata]|eukprot:XP_004355251.1 pirin family protein [Cavenderia fasciculata]